MFGEDRSQSPRMPSPWTSRLSTSLDRTPSPLSLSSNSAADQPGTSRSRRNTSASTTTTAVIQTPQEHHAILLNSQQHSPSLAPLNPEQDTIGNIEYKLKLLPPTRDRFNRLVTQLKWRLLQGGGMAIYEVGVLDDGALVGLSRREMRASLDTLEAMAAQLGARVEVRRVIVVQRTASALSPTLVPHQAHGSNTPTSSSLPITLSSVGESNPLQSLHGFHLDPAGPVADPGSAAVITPSSLKTAAQIHAANKMLNEAYLLRELGAKRRGTRAGPADIAHLGLLDAAQARRWIGGGKRTFSADMRLDYNNSAPEIDGQETSTAGVIAPGEVSQLVGAEMALPLVVLPDEVLSREIEHDKMLEQWEDDLRARRAEAAAFASATYHSQSKHGNGKNPHDASHYMSHRQRRRKSSNQNAHRFGGSAADAAEYWMEGQFAMPGAGAGQNGSALSDAAMAAAAMSLSRKPWLPDQHQFQSRRKNGNGNGHHAGSPRLGPGSMHAEEEEEDAVLPKEGSGPVRIVDAHPAREQPEAHPLNTPSDATLVSSVDESASGEDESEEPSSSQDDDEDAGSQDGSEQADDDIDEDDEDDEGGGFFSFSLSLSDDEDGQIKGGRRAAKKAAKSTVTKKNAPPITKNGRDEDHCDCAAQSFSRDSPPVSNPISVQPRTTGAGRSDAAHLGMMTRPKALGSQRKAEHRAATLERALYRADAEAREQQRERERGRRSSARSPSSVARSLESESGSSWDGPVQLEDPAAADEMVPGSLCSESGMSEMSDGVEASARLAVDDALAESTATIRAAQAIPGDAVEAAPIDTSADIEVKASSATETPSAAMTPTSTAIRFIVEAKVLRKLKKGDVFIDYAGI
ncbi:hypothetical protein OC846_005240 [Tilletia horrida]|uniref:Uncharacterized protein n=1 Tax=Tilletia horrida TaxID=155126 RepID=A0AAN6GNQ0_9BASI|nr:hypothetical protein OC845_005464 [Tilletia horrida]KAK0546473.1 hypothetical protein OC846_005240 [Tilletia horrida]KAK0562250.1 hypothetical protein OC861_005410 [Tilletia horrida]